MSSFSLVRTIKAPSLPSASQLTHDTRFSNPHHHGITKHSPSLSSLQYVSFLTTAILARQSTHSAFPRISIPISISISIRHYCIPAVHTTPNPDKSNQTNKNACKVPGSSQRFIDKSRSLAADCVAYDLEDSVTPHKKAEARSLVRRALELPSPGGIRERAVRINSVDSGLALADLTEVVCLSPPPALLVPYSHWEWDTDPTSSPRNLHIR